MLHESSHQEDGFTMVELMVVVGIVSLLALISIPLYLNQRRSAVDASVKADLNNAASAVDVWIAENPNTAVPELDISRADSSQSSISFSRAAPSPISSIKVGPGTQLSIDPAGEAVGAYTITGTNINGNDSPGGIVWDSYTTGGIK